MSAADPVLSLLRPEILALAPYSSARKESSGGRIWLDANENPLTPSAGKPLLNRYPEPQPAELIAQLAAYYAVAENNILVTRGSDEGIDLLLRAFCRAGQDAILITPPTYGMYAVSAAIQNARVVTVPLLAEKNFSLDPTAVLAAITPSVKLVFLCSPNNPTGALLARDEVVRLVQALLGKAIVVVDEAYLEFAGSPSLTRELAGNPNLVILRTLSKAFGLAGIRCGVTIAMTAEGLTAARRSGQSLIAERIRVAARLATLPCVRRLWPSDSNFILFEVTDSARVMSATRAVGVVLRDRSRDYGLTNCVRMTMGTPEENNAALEVIARV